MPSTLPNHFPPGLRYYPLSAFMRDQFNERVHRVVVDAGFCCPNIDGTVGRGGCIFCENASRSAATQPDATVPQQVQHGIERVRRRFNAEKFMVYFQANSNTHAPLERLRQIYDSALIDPRIVAMAVGTRSDCLGEDVLDLLQDYHRRLMLWVEIGVQTSCASTLEWMNRGHDLQSVKHAARRAKLRGLRLCAHLILGLPGETRDDVRRTAELVRELGFDGVKLHMLYISLRARLSVQYKRAPFPLLSREEYAELATDVLERLPADCVIHRLVSDCPEDDLIAPRWLLDKQPTLALIDAELRRRNSHQGALVH